MQRTSHRYLQVDVFADRPGAGNPLGVVMDADGWDTSRMQAFAGWTNLSETIFFLTPTTPHASYRIRIFTPRQELPFAGHPSVGAAWVAREAGLADDADSLVQECAAGLLPVRVEGDGPRRGISLRAPRARPVDAPASPALLDAVATRLPTTGLPLALWNNGPSWWLVELEDADAVRRLVPDLPAIAALTQATAAVGLAVFGRTPAGRDHDLVVRLLPGRQHPGGSGHRQRQRVHRRGLACSRRPARPRRRLHRQSGTRGGPRRSRRRTGR